MSNSIIVCIIMFKKSVEWMSGEKNSGLVIFLPRSCLPFAQTPVPLKENYKTVQKPAT